MNPEEIKEEATERAVEQTAGRLFSPGNLLTVLISAILVAVSWGIQQEKIDSIQIHLDAIEKREITPGAQAAIGEIRVFDRALDYRVSNIEAEMRTQRSEMMGYLQRIEGKVDAHMNNSK